MTTTLLTTADLAERLRITEQQAMELRRRHEWPCIVFSRKTIRFTEAQADEIVRRHEQAGEVKVDPAPVSLIEGQTAASKRRRSA